MINAILRKSVDLRHFEFVFTCPTGEAMQVMTADALKKLHVKTHRLRGGGRWAITELVHGGDKP